MSSRSLRRAYGSPDDELKKLEKNSDEEDLVAYTATTTNRGSGTQNPYDLLNEMSESEAKEDDGQEEIKSGEDSPSKIDDEGSQIGKKKKKRKKPGKKKRKNQHDSDMTTEDEEVAKQKQRQLKPSPAIASKARERGRLDSTPKETLEFEEIFKLDNRLLNPEFELKKIFGAKVINYERGKQGQRRVYRHSKLISPKEQWPSVTGSGISMIYLNTRNGYMYFKFQHNQAYQNVQRNFMTAVDSLDPDNILSILKIQPYHIDAHITLSDMAKNAEDMQVAAELIEGGLHCLENALNSRFNISLPTCRLEYIYQENRAFFVLLFKHLTYVGQRSLYRTSLELCKRLITLDIEDPLGVVLMIDFYAIKSGELQWLIDFFNFWEPIKNLSQLPNFAHSLALAYHLLSKKKAEAREDFVHLSDKSDLLVQYAMTMFPSVLLPLLDKCNVNCDSRVQNHPYFNAIATNSASPSLKLLCDLYVWRTHHVWKDPSILKWLEKNVHQVLNLVDRHDSRIVDYEIKRKRRYQGSPRNVLRHIILTDNKDLTVSLPPDITSQPILNYDPLPPANSVNIYNTLRVRLNTRNGNTREGIFSLLFRSLLFDVNQAEAPWQFQLNDNPNREGNENAVAVENPERNNEVVGEGAAAGLQQSVTALLDAMRELLTSVRGPGGGGGAGDERADDEVSDDDDDDVDENADLEDSSER